MKKKTKTPIYTSDQVFAISNLLEQTYSLYPATTRQEKSVRSIAFDLEEKFSNKRKQLIKKNSLFEVDKLHKIDLKYHEQEVLVQIIFSLLETVSEPKSKNDLRTVMNYIDEYLL